MNSQDVKDEFTKVNNKLDKLDSKLDPIQAHVAVVKFVGKIMVPVVIAIFIQVFVRG